jgi:hypothetical protein
MVCKLALQQQKSGIPPVAQKLLNPVPVTYVGTWFNPGVV